MAVGALGLRKGLCGRKWIGPLKAMFSQGRSIRLQTQCSPGTGVCLGTVSQGHVVSSHTQDGYF